MKRQSSTLGDASTSPTGQGCLWAVAVGIVAVISFSYLSTYGGVPSAPLDHIENGIAGVTRPVGNGYSRSARYHRRRHVHRVYTHTLE